MMVLHFGADGVAFEILFFVFGRWWICCCGSEVDLGGGLGCDWVDVALRWVWACPFDVICLPIYVGMYFLCTSDDNELSKVFATR